MNIRLFPVLLSLAFLACISPALANPELAEHYISKSPQYLGKKIQVQVAYVSPYAAGPQLPNIVCFTAFTAYQMKIGGSLTVCVDKAEEATFLKKYGQAFQYAGNGSFITKPLSGVLSSSPKLGFLYLDCRESVTNPSPQKK